MPEASREDASLYVRLLEICQTNGQLEARRWVFADFEASTYEELQTKYPRATAERDRLINVLGFFESAGMLVSRGLLNEDVFFDAPLGFESLWPRVRDLIDDIQKQLNEPAAWENVVWLGRRYQTWKEQHWRPKLEAVPPESGPARPEPTVRGFQH